MARYMEPESIHEGKDDRYKQDPIIPEVAYLSAVKESGRNRGTGFLVKIEGQCIVMTAAHCVYDKAANGLAKRVDVYFGRSSKHESPSVVKEQSDIYVPHHYRPVADHHFEQDYAFIYLGKQEKYSKFKGFRLMKLDEEAIRQCEETLITGYPAETASGPEQYHQYSIKLTDIKIHHHRRFLTYGDATSGGMSGAPLYFPSPAGHIAFGIHVNRENGAVWLTGDEINYIEKAVLRRASGVTMGWQEHQITERLESTHIDSRKVKVDKNRQVKVDKNRQPSLEDRRRRLQRDMGCPVHIIGDPTSVSASLVSCPAMILNRERVHSELAVLGDTELVNTEASGGHHHTDQFKYYYGTCSLPIPLSPPSTTRYWETHTRLQVKKDVSGYGLLEMGVTEEGQLDTSLWVSYQRRSSWTVWVRGCSLHPGLICTTVWKEDSRVGECQTDTMSRTPGTDVTLKYGVVVDVARGRLSFIDLDREKVLNKFDIEFTQTLFPMFGVGPGPDDFAAKMRLVSGSDIAMTDKKKSLIFTALS